MNNDDRPEVTIYSDGGCKPNPGPGGWGAVLLYDGHTRDLSGGDPDTTNNRMELTAAIEALETLNRHCRVTIYTDSVYLKNGITRWMYNWVKNGWVTSKNQPVKNADLWRRLYSATRRHDITWKWVKGHAGDKWNEHVDRLATRARAALRSG